MWRAIVDFFAGLFGGGVKKVDGGYVTAATDIWGAGIDRSWDREDATTVCNEAVKAGLTAVSIELGADDRFVRDPAGARKPLEKLLVETRKRKLVLIVTVINRWVGDQEFRNGTADNLLAIMLGQKPEGIIAIPVGESGTSATVAWETKAIAALRHAGFRIGYNGHEGRPPDAHGCDYLFWHSSSTTSNAPRGAIEMTDHGNVIRALGNPQNPTTTAAMARTAYNRKCGFVLYGYDTMSDGPGATSNLPLPLAAWKAMGAVRRGS